MSSSTRAHDPRIVDDEHRQTIDHARVAYGDAFAEVVTDRGLDIDRSTGGRWDCFCAAIDAAKRSHRRIGDLYLWCLRAAQQFAATGIPPAPIAVEPSVPDTAAVEPHLTPAAARHQKQLADIRAYKPKSREADS